MTRVLAAVTVTWITLALPAPGQPDATLVADTVAKVAALVEREYFDAARAAIVAAGLRRALGNGRCEAAASAEELAALLTDDLRAATDDRHLAVTVVAAPPLGPATGRGTPGMTRGPTVASARTTV